jgi:predicted RNA-binding Zn-ribbon protein involved in translation (DUF1610 family)
VASFRWRQQVRFAEEWASCSARACEEKKSCVPFVFPSEGYFRFLCPHCGEMRCTVNPRNNLAHCFCCKKNLNTIDLLISEGYDFPSAVALLKRWLDEYQANHPQKTPTTPPAKPTTLPTQ